MTKRKTLIIAVGIVVVLGAAAVPLVNRYIHGNILRITMGGAGEATSCRSNWPEDARHPKPDEPAGMVWVPGGTATIGSTEVYAEEGPTKTATVKGFWLDRFEVSNAEFADFVKATRYVTTAERSAGHGFPENGSAVFTAAPKEGDGWLFVAGADWRHPDGPDSTIVGHEDDPVVQVSLEDAEAYAKWKGRVLPTEDEWEYAARSGISGETYAWGNELTPDGKYMANTWQGFFPFDNSGADGHMGRAPRGCYPPNQFGLYDMIGNVWEWTKSFYFPSHDPSEQETDRFKAGYDPRQPGVPVAVIKGGSYLCAPNYCRRYRPAARFAQETLLGTNHIGFRTALYASGQNDEPAAH